MDFDVETFVSSGSPLVGKNCGWVRGNIGGLHIIHVHAGIGEVLERKNPPDTCELQAGDYIHVKGTQEATSKLVDLSVPSSR